MISYVLGGSSGLSLLGQRVWDALDGLGETPLEVAQSLRDAGVVGAPRTQSGCVLAVFLRQRLGPDAVVDVSEYVTVRRLDDVVCVPAPAACVQFMVAFDRLEFDPRRGEVVSRPAANCTCGRHAVDPALAMSLLDLVDPATLHLWSGSALLAQVEKTTVSEMLVYA